MTNEKKLTIQQLAQEVNSELKKTVSSATDARYSPEISERRIRDYMTKGLLDKPFGQGREKWFSKSHIEKLLALRNLQADGLSDQYLKKISNSSSEPLFASSSQNFSSVENTNNIGNSFVRGFSGEVSLDGSLREGALNFLSTLNQPKTPIVTDLKASSQLFASSVSGSSGLVSKSLGESMVQNYYNSGDNKSQALEIVKKQINKVWNEYQLDDEGKVFLKMESNTKITNPEVVLEQIKSILNIGEKK